MARNTRSKGRTHRGFIIALQADDRYDVFLSKQDADEGHTIAEDFKEISIAMEWIDGTQF